MRVILNVFLLLLSLGSLDAFSQAVHKVVIIRHGEKPDSGTNLSCQGLNRALKLPDVLYSKYKIPNHIFVPDIKGGKSTNVSRMYQTIVPFAIKYNLDIDTRFNIEETKELVNAILNIPGYVLIVWEHDKIPKIVHALGIKRKDLKWKDSDFDSIWIITFKKDGTPVLTIDQENITPLVNCN